MKFYLFIIISTFSVSFCQAQISIGPTLGLNYSFVEFQNSTKDKMPLTESYQFERTSNPAPLIGYKAEIPVNNSFFITINNAFVRSNNKIYDCYSRCETWLFQIDQILVMSSLNYMLPKQFSLGLGVNYLYGRYDRKYTLLDIKPNFRDVGVLFSGNFKYNQFVLELLYIHSIKSFGSTVSDGIFILKPIHTFQLSISYLIRNKFRFNRVNRKDLDCPKF